MAAATDTSGAKVAPPSAEPLSAAPVGVAPLGRMVVPLLAVAVFINYIDRGNLATAAPLMKDELKLSGSQIGLLLSVFFWTYVPFQLLAGWLAERINAYRTLAIGLAIWSVATAATGLASSFSILIALRLLLGIGESVAFPCSSKLIGQHLPADKLGGANGMVALGLSLGPAFGTFTGGLLMAHVGWRAVFVVFGLISLLWLWPWLAQTRRAWPAPEAKWPPAPTYGAIMRRMEAWGAGLGHFCNNYAFYFVISWLPLYLVKSRGFTVPQMAEIGGLVYLVYAASAFITGRLTDRWMRAGASATRVRKTAALAACAVAAASLVVCALGDRTLSVAGLFAAGIGFGFNSAGIYAIGQTLAGPGGSGKWVGFQNFLGNTAGIVGPLVTGFIIDKTGEFVWAFLIAGAVSLIGAIGWSLMIPRIEPLKWEAA